MHPPQLSRKTDRRRPNRPETPLCERCTDDRLTSVSARTAQVVYFRCEGCGWLTERVLGTPAYVAVPVAVVAPGITID